MTGTPEATHEMEARIVYWGIQGAGKSTNLAAIERKLRPDHRGRLRRVPTSLDPTVSYELLPIELGNVSGVRTLIEAVAVPGAPEHAPTRKQLLDRVDGIVFVIDSRRELIDANLAAFDELRSALAAYGRALAGVPLVIQYNKRDLPNAAPLDEMRKLLNTLSVPDFEAKAQSGEGVFETLKAVAKGVLTDLKRLSR